MPLLECLCLQEKEKKMINWGNSIELNTGLFALCLRAYVGKFYFSFLGINDQIGRHLRDENKIRYKLKLMKVLEPSGTR